MSKNDDKHLIQDLIDKLFKYSDELNFEGLKKEVLAEYLIYDVSSAGGINKKMSSTEVCDLIKEYSTGLDGNNRIMGDIIIKINDNNTAEVLTTAIVTHYKKKSKKGNVREFTGNYHIILNKINDYSWRIISFTYSLNHTSGNLELD